MGKDHHNHRSSGKRRGSSKNRRGSSKNRRSSSKNRQKRSSKSPYRSREGGGGVEDINSKMAGPWGSIYNSRGGGREGRENGRESSRYHYDSDNSDGYDSENDRRKREREILAAEEMNEKNNNEAADLCFGRRENVDNGWYLFYFTSILAVIIIFIFGLGGELLSQFNISPNPECTVEGVCTFDEMNGICRNAKPNLCRCRPINLDEILSFYSSETTTTTTTPPDITGCEAVSGFISISAIFNTVSLIGVLFGLIGTFQAIMMERRAHIVDIPQPENYSGFCGLPDVGRPVSYVGAVFSVLLIYGIIFYFAIVVGGASNYSNPPPELQECSKGCRFEASLRIIQRSLSFSNSTSSEITCSTFNLPAIDGQQSEVCNCEGSILTTIDSDSATLENVPSYQTSVSGQIIEVQCSVVDPSESTFPIYWFASFIGLLFCGGLAQNYASCIAVMSCWPKTENFNRPPPAYRRRRRHLESRENE